MAGIVETKQALIALIDILTAVRRAGADGWQLSDISLIIRDDELRNAIVAALEGAQLIPGELGSLSFAEMLELIAAISDALKQIT
jgi:hypothetical protein